MNPAQLLAHFHRISDARGAIPRLRQFILDLAVRGKLVEQDPSDEPASTLQALIHDEKALLVGEKRIKSSMPHPISVNEEGFGLPSSWRWCRIEDACLSVTDGDHQPPPKADGGVPFLVIGNVRTQVVDFAGCRHVSKDYYNALDEFHTPRAGDILYTLVGSYGIPVLVADNKPFCVQRHIGILRPSAQLHAAFLVRALASRWIFAQATACATGIAQKTVSLSGLRKILLPLPPTAEQHRIASKVYELMTLCDQLEAARVETGSRRSKLVAASLQRLNQLDADASAFKEHARFHLGHLPRLTTSVEHIKQLRQTILNLAVRGRLVHQDPKDEPTSSLLERIAEEKGRLVKARVMKLAEQTSVIDDMPCSVPSSWRWVRISDLLLGDSQNGYSKKPDDAIDGIPILRISAGTVRQDGVVAEEEHKLIGGISAAQREQYELRRDDLLACRFNGNRLFVGRLSIYRDYLGLKPIYPDKLIRLRLLSDFVMPQLVRWFAESSLVRADIESYCATTVGNWGISAANIKKVKIPLPPFAEQHRIVAKVDELMALCDRLEAQLTTTQTESRRLLEAVLHQALAQAA